MLKFYPSMYNVCNLFVLGFVSSALPVIGVPSPPPPAGFRTIDSYSYVCHSQRITRLEAVISQRTCALEFYLQLKRLLVITRGSKLTSMEHFWELLYEAAGRTTGKNESLHTV